MSKRIRRPLTVLMVSVLLVALAAGAALAITRYCPGGGANCFGTTASDTMYDGRGTDHIWAYGGPDYIHAYNYRLDYDEVNGGSGNDIIGAYDDGNSRYYDVVRGGPGYDECYMDNQDRYRGCEYIETR
jgi:hypothetical protein